MARIEWANALRGVAAVAVALGAHLVFGFWSFPAVATVGRFPAEAIDLSGVPLWFSAMREAMAALGVGLFFGISGVVIGLSLERYSRRGFLVGRLMRLMPVWVVGYTAAVAAAVAASRHFTGADSVPATTWTGLVPGLPTALGVPAVTTAVEWTLVVELAFYALCLVLGRRLAGSWGLLWLSAIACLAGFFLIVEFDLFAGGALAGMRALLLMALVFLPLLLATMSSGTEAPTAARMALWVFIVVEFWWMSSQPEAGVFWASPLYKSVILAAVAAVGALALRQPAWGSHRVLGRLADISYPLYVVHAVIGYSVIAALVIAGVPALVATLAAVALVVAVASGIHIWVEVPTHQVGRRWARSMSCGQAVTQPTVHANVIDLSEPPIHEEGSVVPRA